jgi:hypothetical protein
VEKQAQSPIGLWMAANAAKLQKIRQAMPQFGHALPNGGAEDGKQKTSTPERSTFTRLMNIHLR